MYSESQETVELHLKSGLSIFRGISKATFANFKNNIFFHSFLLLAALLLQRTEIMHEEKVSNFFKSFAEIYGLVLNEDQILKIFAEIVDSKYFLWYVLQNRIFFKSIF